MRVEAAIGIRQVVGLASLHGILQQHVGRVGNKMRCHEHSGLSRTCQKSWYLRYVCVFLCIIYFCATYCTGPVVLSKPHFFHIFPHHYEHVSTVQVHASCASRSFPQVFVPIPTETVGPTVCLRAPQKSIKSGSLCYPYKEEYCLFWGGS